jgi:Fe-S-cluster-containing hydrogenase component 2
MNPEPWNLYGKEFAMSRFIAMDHLPCTGCKSCEMICSLIHFGQCNPSKSAIRIIRREKEGLVFCLPLVCRQCDPAPCIEACPSKAISRNTDGGALVLDKERCSDCGLCTEACPFGCVSVDKDTGRLVACDLCGGIPQCVPACHAGCLTERQSDGNECKKEVDRITGILKREHLTDRIPGRRTL